MAAAPVLATLPLLTTQLSIPPLPHGIIERPRLRAALERGAERPLMLVCGPAGSGKTIALSSTFGAAAYEASVAWVSLNPGDDRPGRLAAAILAVLRGSETQAPPTTLRRLLVGELARLPGPMVLVLDDVHVLRARECREQLAELVTHPPEGLRLVLGSRSDPVLPLHLARLHGSLTEIRMRDLAFTQPEAGELLAAHGLELAPELVAALCERTEGWAAGLRLAALGLQHRPDPERFVAEFAGDDRVVADYLLAEALRAEPPRRRAFLLQTSIAERLCGELADAITGRDDGAVTLEALERDNGFLIALDTQRRWYRLHRLFAELLRVHARRELGDELGELHRRAARWHVAAAQPAEALRHAALGADWDLATDLVAAHWLELSARSETGTLRTVLAQLPRERREGDPRIAAVLACLELEAGEAADAGRHLAQATAGLESLPPLFRARHLDTIAIAQLRTAHVEGRPERARGIAGGLLDATGPRDGWSPRLRQAVAHLQLGVAGVWSADRGPAVEALDAALMLAREIGLPGVAQSALGHLALVEVLRSGPAAASELAREALAGGRPATVDAAPGQVAAALIALYEQRLDDVATHLSAAGRALAGGENAALSATLELVTAEFDAARGDAHAALRRLDGLALRRTAFDAAIVALRARLLAEQLGDRAGALAALVPRHAGSPELDVAAARLELANGDPAAALEALQREHEAAPLLGVTLVEASLLEAVAHEQLRDRSAADAAFERALAHAETSGHRGVFVTAGRGVEPLLRRRIRQGTAHAALVCGLLNATEPQIASTHAAAPLLEALSDREAMILRYLPTSLSNREIASELFVTTNTVKTHLRSIYRKLGVAGRREAVERARALGLSG